MKLITKIFRRNDWYVTSKYGWRNCPFHGKEFHAGVDYGTHVHKWPIYAVNDGYVHIIHNGNKGYGNYIWIRYPSLNISILHAHLSKISVKSKQKVTSGTLLGYTGKSGNATGIHLHLGMTKIGSSIWINPHDYNYEDPNPQKEIIYTVKKGDTIFMGNNEQAIFKTIV